MADKKLRNFVEKYGPIAGPKMYHALQSRAAYIGVSSRLRKTLAELKGTSQPARKSSPKPGADATPLFDRAEAGPSAPVATASLGG